MSQKQVLIVEDEITQLTLLESIAKRAGFDVETAMTGREAVTKLQQSGNTAYDIMLLDLMMPEMNGIQVLEAIRPQFPNLPIIMLTAQSSIKTVVEAMKAGANDFIVKPASAERIRTALEGAKVTHQFMGEIAPMKHSLKEAGFSDLVGDSAPMKKAIKLATKAASASIPVLIDGESGVGKEVFARAIHAESDRASKPFVAVNCGAIPENLVESILFGHEKGSFTGATEKRIGKFQEANGGTLFLDEVGELPLDIQVKLLRAIQEKEVDPVGGKQSLKVDIRIISATNRDLATQVAEGAFREDLFYRLNVYPITLPPLSTRKDDIPALTSHFLKHITAMEDLPERTISPSALRLLSGYDWPGNIRQLQNVLFRAVILSEHESLTLDDFPHLQANKPDTSEETTEPTQPAEATTGEKLRLTNGDGHIRKMAQFEADIIAHALNKYEGRMAEISRRLGIGRSTLYRKVSEYGLDKDINR